MNLVSLELEDYRQFAGPHTFEPAQQSMAAIIGPNGAGKTTLFEAIEWCLYNPTYIRNDEIRPRLLGGKPRVKVTLEHPLTGERWEIERELGLRTVTASIYRSSQPENPVVQGTRQVTEYVAKNLLGLSQQAFVATFFTRQKELSFFGSMSDAVRRREVGKLLGLETIRLAQQSIGEQRQQKQQDAAHHRRLHDDQMQGRDFEAERLVAGQQVGTSREMTGQIQERLTNLFTSLEAARTVAQSEEERANRFNALRLEETELTGRLARTAVEIEGNRKTVIEIDLADKQIDELQPLAARAESLAAAVAEHEHQRTLTERAGELKRRLLALDQSAQSIFGTIDTVAARLEPEPRRAIGDLAADQIAAGIDQLIEAASAIQSSALQERLSQLERCSALARSLDEQQSRAARYDNEVAGIAAAIAAISADPPQESLNQAEQDRNAAASDRTAAMATVGTLTTQRATLEGLRARLESGRFDEPCPTCGRPYLAEDLERDVAALQSQVESLDLQIGELNARAAEAEKRVAESAARIDQARSRLAELERQRSRLASSEEPIAEAKAQLERTRAQFEELLAALDRAEAPSEGDIAAARASLQTARDREQEAPLLRQLKRDYETNQADHTQVERDLASIGPFDYDQSRHQMDIGEWRIASDAVAKIDVLLKTVASRETIEASLATAENQSRSTEAQIVTVRAAIEVLAFQPDALAAARAEQRLLQSSYESGLAELNQAERELARAENSLASIEQEEKRLQRLLSASIDSQRLADEFDRMYREFSRFEQYVARTVTPAIAEITSQLVASVTEGKYDRIEFTEDFGIEVFDGEDDSFPLSQFSGGERDVIALCARLALSQFIGGQSATPPQFVVLDEVFGSLDRVRRENLMETLQKLIAESGVFKQLFVISHVEDVQTSAAVDEVWRVRETAEGISQLEQLTGVSLPEEL
ncbi:MAG: SMC family ATPase [Thermomicrobiales bacterium]|nr:SMC family ATPase [Thermomicrobiales bacterium]